MATLGRIDEEAPVRMVLISDSIGSVLEDRMLVWIVWNDGWRFMSSILVTSVSSTSHPRAHRFLHAVSMAFMYESIGLLGSCSMW